MEPNETKNPNERRENPQKTRSPTAFNYKELQYQQFFLIKSTASGDYNGVSLRAQTKMP
jgi:hypothetical protein